MKKKNQTDGIILVPNMLPVHFALLVRVFARYGYQLEVLQNTGPEVVNTGLKYVHNDTCYPALLVIGQMISALQSGKYDLAKTSLLITQTGGGCRASNYIHLLRKALEKAELGHIPVYSLNIDKLEEGRSIAYTPMMAVEVLMSVFYGDALMLMKNQVEPYEKEKGATQRLTEVWAKKLTDQYGKLGFLSLLTFSGNLKQMARDFDAIPHTDDEKIKVGIVGEIYVKYASMGNNHLEKFLLSQGCEVNMPGLMGFLAYCVDVRVDDIDLYGGSKKMRFLYARIVDLLTHYEKKIARVIRKNSRFMPARPTRESKARLDGLLSGGCKMGEGWLLTAEMIELIESGVNNIVCVQPFGCLPNHIVGKGTIRPLRERFPKANIVPVDYDPSATRVNQENRLKLMLAVARENRGE